MVTHLQLSGFNNPIVQVDFLGRTPLNSRQINDDFRSGKRSGSKLLPPPYSASNSAHRGGQKSFVHHRNAGDKMSVCMLCVQRHRGLTFFLSAASLFFLV